LPLLLTPELPTTPLLLLPATPLLLAELALLP
jgi:hypothetical protein